MQDISETSQSFQPSTLLISLDFDGCTDSPESREALAKYIADYCQENRQYTEVIVAIGSLRQSIYTDLSNAISNSRFFAGRLLSTYVLLTEFVEKLVEKIAENGLIISVTPETFLTADLYNSLNPGDTFELMKASDYVEISGINEFRQTPVNDMLGRNISFYSLDEFNDWLEENINYLSEDEKARFLSSWGTSVEEFDEYVEYVKSTQITRLQLKDTAEKHVSMLEKTGPLAFSNGDSFHYDDTDKCLTLYILYQHIHRKYRKTFDSMHFDDRKDLLNIMETFYLRHNHLILERSSLINVEWNAYEMTPSRGVKIVGTGTANPDYQIDAKEIARKCLALGISSTQYIQVYFDKKKEEEAQRSIFSGFSGLTIHRPVARRANQTQLKTTIDSFSNQGF